MIPQYNIVQNNKSVETIIITNSNIDRYSHRKHTGEAYVYTITETVILHSLICRVLLLLLLLHNASDLRNCTSYFGACMWVRYCRPPIGAHFHPTPQPPPVPQQLGEKDGSPLLGVARLCRGRRPPLGNRTRLVLSIYLIIILLKSYFKKVSCSYATISCFCVSLYIYVCVCVC